MICPEIPQMFICVWIISEIPTKIPSEITTAIFQEYGREFLEIYLKIFVTKYLLRWLRNFFRDSFINSSRVLSENLPKTYLHIYCRNPLGSLNRDFFSENLIGIHSLIHSKTLKYIRKYFSVILAEIPSAISKSIPPRFFQNK